MIGMVISTIFTSKEAKRRYTYDWDLITDNLGIFQPDYTFEDARVLLQLSMMVTNMNFEKTEFDPPEWLQTTVLKYDTCPVEIISKGIPNSSLNDPTPLGHTLYDQRSNTLIIIFSGTSNACMASLDLDYAQTDLVEISNYEPGLRGHKGIYNGYKSIRPQLLKAIAAYADYNPQIVITGHSLGAALSSLCALDLAYYNPIHYSFASPLFFNQVGSRVFEKLVPTSYRIMNLSDMVALFPLPIMPTGDTYCHVGTMIPFQQNLGEYHRNHALAYMTEYDLHFTEVFDQK